MTVRQSQEPQVYFTLVTVDNPLTKCFKFPEKAKFEIDIWTYNVHFQKHIPAQYSAFSKHDYCTLMTVLCTGTFAPVLSTAVLPTQYFYLPFASL